MSPLQEAADHGSLIMGLKPSDLELFRRLRVWPGERGLIDIAGIDAPTSRRSNLV
jgi:hypothetical protein